ncbi:histidine phosphatase family protein [Heyndrickxia sporothermodurans]|uniref:Histidine phosphatase family protein n=1 Tax=Heyndrickxia sporothermodurans TaxID=46224 RepID=A0A150KY26_9BACI|nr:histidine phosphatase family protein [Heyndrickxia sporothermodurans]KYD04322.1 hypothetical protein B4102_3284 [Heyndrickxia sporothermodurans]MBL5768753.1 histidine phosphatase family protein [Heyndrickxia sporothermodurans]MBL5772336.1 histidine phosphatase family protein [Heyndrickxia sporothermodurans]MBL5775867.1 histidine phosphatase family protein [Heyndrickxia sporothermodurans]MBL5779409.1 histidine phosphatase family protein [Heyndrickxia sporothermodurans]
MTIIYFVRHGESEWNASGNRYCGRTDIKLSNIGKQQAQMAATLLQDVQFTGAYSSPLCRARETGEYILLNHEEFVPIQNDERLIEANFGEWEGKRLEVFIAEDPKYWDQWLKDPGSTKAGKTGENAFEIFQRVNEFVNDVVNQHPEGTILVTAHSWVIRFFVAGTLEIPFRNYRMIAQDNVGVTIFKRTKDDEGRFLAINLNTHIKKS